MGMRRRCFEQVNVKEMHAWVRGICMEFGYQKGRMFEVDSEREAQFYFPEQFKKNFGS